MIIDTVTKMPSGFLREGKNGTFAYFGTPERYFKFSKNPKRPSCIER